MSNEKKFTTTEAAKMLGIHRTTALRRAIKLKIGQQVGSAGFIFSKEEIKKLRVG